MGINNQDDQDELTYHLLGTLLQKDLFCEKDFLKLLRKLDENDFVKTYSLQNKIKLYC